MQRFQGGLVGVVYHSSLGLRVIKREREVQLRLPVFGWSFGSRGWVGLSGLGAGFNLGPGFENQSGVPLTSEYTESHNIPGRP